MFSAAMAVTLTIRFFLRHVVIRLLCMEAARVGATAARRAADAPSRRATRSTSARVVLRPRPNRTELRARASPRPSARITYEPFVLPVAQAEPADRAATSRSDVM